MVKAEGEDNGFSSSNSVSRTMNNSSSSSESCSPFDNNTYVTVAIISAVTALISTIACAGVIALIIILRKHYFYTQRLILYLNIAALLNSVSIVLRLQRIGYKSDSDALEGLCVFTGAFDHITAWSELIAICCITINLLLNAVFHKNTEKLEKVYFILIFFFPLTFNWIPFIKNTYGKAGAWCWIRGQDDDTCEDFQFGIYLRFILWYVPSYVILAILLVIYILIIYKVGRNRRQFEGKYDPETDMLKKQMQKEVRPLLWYPLIYFILNIFPLMNRVHDTIETDPELTLWILHAIFSPLQGGFIAVAFTLDKETLQRLKVAELKAAVLNRGGSKITEYPFQAGHTDSFRAGDSSTKVRSGTEQKHTYNGTGTVNTKL